MNSYLQALARGHITGATPISAYGERTTAGAESNVLWPNGDYAFPPTSGVQMAIVSSSANDTAAGTGLQSIALEYLDADLNPLVEIVTLNGLTPVNTVATNIRFIQCMHVVTVGSNKAAVGNITATNGGNTYSYIGASHLRCTSSVRVVPKGKRLIATSFYGGSASGSAAAAVILRFGSPQFSGYDLQSQNIFVPQFAAAFQDNSAGLTVISPGSFSEGQAVGLTFTTNKAATIVGQWFGWLESV